VASGAAARFQMIHQRPEPGVPCCAHANRPESGVHDAVMAEGDVVSGLQAGGSQHPTASPSRMCPRRPGSSHRDPQRTAIRPGQGRKKPRSTRGSLTGVTPPAPRPMRRLTLERLRRDRVVATNTGCGWGYTRAVIEGNGKPGD
jgi:hypothetical protein